MSAETIRYPYNTELASLAAFKLLKDTKVLSYMEAVNLYEALNYRFKTDEVNFDFVKDFNPVNGTRMEYEFKGIVGNIQLQLLVIARS